LTAAARRSKEEPRRRAPARIDEAGLSFSAFLRSPRGAGVLAALVALALDQGHKLWMLRIFDIETRQPIRLAPFLDIVLSWNRGISYSLLPAHGDAARLALLALQLAIVAGLCVWMARAPAKTAAVALGLIVGGALGNALDRLFRGAVADFFYLHTELPVGPLANYVFNVADAFITLGVALLLAESLLSHPAEPGPVV
jgi:signal peptidase II